MKINQKGLSSKNAKSLLEKYGLNEIRETNKLNWIKILLNQIKQNFVFYLLLVAMITSYFVGKIFTTYVILIVILVTIATGFIQEYKAEKSVQALKKMLTPVSIVIRDGKEQEISSNLLVPGDILILRTGERIPADCIILEEKEILVNESILTGESQEVKKTESNEKKNLEDLNKLFMGTFIVNGRCIAKVLETGMNTRFGKIAGMISSAEKELPLRKKINKIAKWMAFIGIIVSISTGLMILSYAEEINQDTVVNVLLMIVAIAVSAFPEAFPVVLITSLSSGAYRMSLKNAIVNRMSIIETLGETTVICSDKTGTITKGEMTVKKILTNNKIFEVSGIGYEGIGDFSYKNNKINLNKEPTLNLLLKSSLICNDSHIERTGEDKIYKIIGTPTEGALLIACAKADLHEDDLSYLIEQEFPFSSERKMMSVIANEKGKKNLYSKGALEIILNKCTKIQRDDGIFTLKQKDKEKILEINKELNLDCFRTLGIAYKEIRGNLKKEEFEKELIFLGLTAMEDPAREEISDALVMCKTAGISVKMITGDHKDTAISVAKKIGLDKGGILTGEEIDKMTDKQLASVVKKIVIFTRVKPEHKLRIVKALKENGEIVTMTGDGVNDAPALKEAHIGVAMGIGGTEVSRSASDLILKDDNFATIVDAIKEGRTIFNNIRKFVTYQLSCNVAELSILFFGVLLAHIFGWEIPILLAIHVLFMNLVTSDIPAVSLSLNKSSRDIMEELPRRKTSILTKSYATYFIISGIIMAIFTLLVYYISFNILGHETAYARTNALVVLIVIEIFAAFSFRSFRKGVFGRSIFVNNYLVYASLISIIATVLIIYTPLNKIMETVPIGYEGWATSIVLCILFVAIFDAFKKINNNKKLLDFD